MQNPYTISKLSRRQTNRRWLFGFLLCWCTVAFSQPDQSDIRQHFEAAHQAQLSGDLAAAAKEYVKVLRIDPNIPEVYANLGLVYYQERDFAQSAKVLARAEALKPGLRGVSLYLGIDDVKLGDATQAIPHLQKSVQMEPASKEANTWLGTALWDAGRISAALAQLRASCALFPTDVDDMFLLGEAYRKAGNQEVQSALDNSAGTYFADDVYGDIYTQQRAWTKAAAHYKHAIQINPRSSRSYFGLGVVSLRQNQLTQARQYFQHALDLTPASAGDRARLAEVDLLEGKTQEALTMLDAAVKAAPGDAVSSLDFHPALMTMNEHYDALMKNEAHSSLAGVESAPVSAGRELGLALLFARLGDAQQSTRYWKEFNNLVWARPLDSREQYKRAVLNYDRERYLQAAGQIEVWLASHHADVRSRYLLSKAYSVLSRATVEHMLSMDPNSIRVHQLAAESYGNSGDDYKAIEEYTLVARMDPTLPGVHFAIGQLLWKNEESAKALLELRKELTLNPNHAEANAEIGTILVAQHDPQSAIPYLIKALKLAPDLTLVHQQLGDAYFMDKEYAKAATELTRALPYDKDGTAHYLLGSVYRSEGKMEQAKGQFAIARKMKSEKVQAEVLTSSRLEANK